MAFLPVVVSACATVLASLISSSNSGNSATTNHYKSQTNNLAIHENAIQVKELMRFPVDDLIDPYRRIVEHESKKQYKAFKRDYWVFKQKMSMSLHLFGAFFSALATICLFWSFCSLQEKVNARFLLFDINLFLPSIRFVSLIVIFSLVCFAVWCLMICYTIAMKLRVDEKQQKCSKEQNSNVFAAKLNAEREQVNYSKKQNLNVFAVKLNADKEQVNYSKKHNSNICIYDSRGVKCGNQKYYNSQYCSPHGGN